MNGNSAAFSAVEMFDLVSTPIQSARRLSFSSFPFPVRNECDGPKNARLWEVVE